MTSCVLQSEIGSRLSANFPFVAIMFELGDKRIWSLRSHMTRGINVAEIARQHARRRVVSVLEGGYSLDGLARAVGAHVGRLSA